MQILSDLLKDDPGLTLTYIMSMSNLVPYAFKLEKGRLVNFSEPSVSKLVDAAN